jgi:hypothetical protein
MASAAPNGHKLQLKAVLVTNSSLSPALPPRDQSRVEQAAVLTIAHVIKFRTPGGFTS